MADPAETLADILAILAANGAACDVFGGWAEELLGLRAPWPHSDIDLIHRADSFAGLDLALALLESVARSVPAKHFPHKRAFVFREMLCEVILVRNDGIGPVTYFWGDVAYRWEQPLLHPQAVKLGSVSLSIVSAANLIRYRRDKKLRQSDRWQEFSQTAD